MRKLMWLFSGAVLGFIAAHMVNETPEGRRFFTRVNRGMDELSRAFVHGYREAESDVSADADAEAAEAAAAALRTEPQTRTANEGR